MYATERREGEKGVEGKASSRAKCWWEGADQLREVALLLVHQVISFFMQRDISQAAHTRSPQPPNHGGALPEIKELGNQTIFQLGTGGL